MSGLTVGLKHVSKVVVTDDMTPPHLRSEPLRVLSTPNMIALIERAAIECVQPHLAPGQATCRKAASQGSLRRAATLRHMPM